MPNIIFIVMKRRITVQPALLTDIGILKAPFLDDMLLSFV